MTVPPTSPPGRLAALRQPEMLVALAAIVLSICGLFVALYEASIARRAERASVWPHLAVGVSVHGTAVSVWVRNSGVGPARVRAAHLSHRGAVLDDWRALLRGLEIDVGDVRTTYSLIGGRVLGVTEDTETLFSAELRPEGGDPDATRRLAVALLEGDADVVVCYCSVYDQCWIARASDLMQRRRGVPPPAADEVADCAAVAHSAI